MKRVSKASWPFGLKPYLWRGSEPVSNRKIGMEFRAIGETEIAEVIADGIVVNSVEDGVDLIGNVYYRGFDKVILYQENVSPDFFDLKTGMAGEILQKFSNYRVRLAIVGDFSGYTSNALRDFIRESNTGKLVNFLSSKEEAVNSLSAG
ncbi:MAG TPA: DUF4180 domain-containing protein [Parapedobacter sp.]|nr:DUF4180 domain-containing protein [Parapedobacter sp.]